MIVRNIESSIAATYLKQFRKQAYIHLSRQKLTVHVIINMLATGYNHVQFVHVVME